LSHRRLAHSALASLLAVGVFLALAAAPAFANRAYESQITEANGAAFTNPYGLAVDGSDNLWVSDAHGGGTVDKFNSSGSYESQTPSPPWSGTYIESLAFSAAANKIFVTDSNHDDLWGLNPDATYSGTDLHDGLDTGCCFLRIAADNSGGEANGDLYVSNGSAVLRIDSAGNAVPFAFSAPYIEGNKLTGPFAGAHALAVDANGNLYVAASAAVYEFKPSGEFTGTKFTEAGGEPLSAASAVAVDPTSENVLIADSAKGVIDEFEPSGTFIESLSGAETPATAFGALLGLAVNSAGELYVSDGSNAVVDVFGPARVLPKVTYGAVSNAGHTSGTLNATVDPNAGGKVEACQFEYGEAASYGQIAPCLDTGDVEIGTPSNPIESPTEVHADISALTSEITYRYRILVADPQGTKHAGDRTFTPTAIFGVITDPASNPVAGNETLNGSFTGDGNDTTFYFEYVDVAGYNPAAPDPYSAGQTTAVPPGTDAGAGTGTQSVSATANLPSPYILYHYRIVATNSFGTSYGADQTFFSPPPNLPTVDATSASGVTPSSATLNAQINPGFGPTIVRFQYGTTTSYGTQTFPSDSIGSDGVDHPASVDISDLTPGTTYHFRAVATNIGGVVQGPDQTLNTPDLPGIADTAASGITDTTATLGARIRPGFSPTTYRFEYGPTAAYGSTTPESASIGSDNSVHNVSASLAALSSATTYHFRIVAANGIGTTTGPDQTFTTAAPPSNNPPPLTCKRGFVKRQGKCVKAHKHHRHKKRSASHG
jgi:hypothetical protein